jgi:acylphosphatase
MDRVHLLIRGRVQGVGFRYFAWERARELGLAGEVRNRPEGLVEVIAEGKRARLQELADAVRVGPRAARVSTVEETWSEAPPGYSGFRITG